MSTPATTTSPVEDPRLETSKDLLTLVADRAGAFVQPDPQKRPPMTLAKALVINAIISVPLVDRAWPRNGRRYAIRYFSRITASQNRLARLMWGIPVLRYKSQLRCFDMLADRQMEEVRLFCILVNVLREVTGSREANHERVIKRYHDICVRRQFKLLQDLRRFVRMVEEMMNQGENVAGVGGAAQEGGN